MTFQLDNNLINWGNTYNVLIQDLTPENILKQRFYNLINIYNITKSIPITIGEYFLGVHLFTKVSLSYNDDFKIKYNQGPNDLHLILPFNIKNILDIINTLPDSAFYIENLINDNSNVHIIYILLCIISKIEQKLNLNPTILKLDQLIPKISIDKGNYYQFIQ